MQPIIQKQQQILKQNLSKFENRATQISYSLNKMQYLLYNNKESAQNKEFIQNEYSFLKTVVNQVGLDLNAFLTSSDSNKSSTQIQPLIPNLKPCTINNNIKEEEDEENNDKEISNQQKFDGIDEEEDDDEYDEQQSQQKSNQNQGVVTRKKIIEKEKIYPSAFSSNSQNKINQNGYNNSNSSSESQDYPENGNHKDGSHRQVRKKKYSPDLRKKLIEEVKRKNFSYRKLCKKYNINYGTAYYLINSIQKELGDQQQGVENSDGNNVQKSQIQGNIQGQTSDKQNVGETGRTKYQEEYKQQLYVESMCGLSYKDISDKHKVSYETCYYLISTIKNQAQKDHALNKQLKEKIKIFQETIDLNKQDSQGKNGKQINTIPSTTALTRGQQAILNGNGTQSQEANRNNKSENDTIAIDDEEEEKNQKKSNNIDISQYIDDINKQKILNVLQVEDEGDQIEEDQEKNSMISEENAEEKIEQEDENTLVENSKDILQNVKNIKKIQLDQQQKNSQESVKTSGSAEDVNTSTD